MFTFWFDISDQNLSPSKVESLLWKNISLWVLSNYLSESMKREITNLYGCIPMVKIKPKIIPRTQNRNNPNPVFEILKIASGIS